MSLEIAKEKGNSTLVQVIEQYLRQRKIGADAESTNDVHTKVRPIVTYCF